MFGRCVRQRVSFATRLQQLYPEIFDGETNEKHDSRLLKLELRQEDPHSVISMMNSWKEWTDDQVVASAHYLAESQYLTDMVELFGTNTAQRMFVSSNRAYNSVFLELLRVAANRGDVGLFRSVDNLADGISGLEEYVSLFCETHINFCRNQMDVTRPIRQMEIAHDGTWKRAFGVNTDGMARQLLDSVNSYVVDPYGIESRVRYTSNIYTQLSEEKETGTFQDVVSEFGRKLSHQYSEAVQSENQQLAAHVVSCFLTFISAALWRVVQQSSGSYSSYSEKLGSYGFLLDTKISDTACVQRLIDGLPEPLKFVDVLPILQSNGSRLISLVDFSVARNLGSCFSILRLLEGFSIHPYKQLTERLRANCLRSPEMQDMARFRVSIFYDPSLNLVFECSSASQVAEYMEQAFSDGSLDWESIPRAIFFASLLSKSRADASGANVEAVQDRLCTLIDDNVLVPSLDFGERLLLAQAHVAAHWGNSRESLRIWQHVMQNTTLRRKSYHVRFGILQSVIQSHADSQEMKLLQDLFSVIPFSSFGKFENESKDNNLSSIIAQPVWYALPAILQAQHAAHRTGFSLRVPFQKGTVSIDDCVDMSISRLRGPI